MMSDDWPTCETCDGSGTQPCGCVGGLKYPSADSHKRCSATGVVSCPSCQGLGKVPPEWAVEAGAKAMAATNPPYTPPFYGMDELAKAALLAVALKEQNHAAP